MINSKRVLGLILARAGSKGLPGKNIKLINGKPLISWSINAAKDSLYIDDLVVSTDGPQIASVAEKFGAEVPFIRPKELASDTASSVSGILHAIDWLAQNGRFYEIVVLLEPTSPLRTAKDIDSALELMQKKSATSVVSVCAAECSHPSFLFSMNEDAVLQSYSGRQPNGLRRQDIDPLYFLDGTVYCSDIDTLKLKNGFYHAGTYGYIVPKWKSLEIDDADDFVMVEALMRARELC